jgi:Bifunctional DNA primase/polymerase, N-terminal
VREFNDQPPNAKTALYYASRGWDVLPVQEDFCSATRDPILIKQWDWAKGIGMACGERSRTDVLAIYDAEAFAAAGFNLHEQVTSTLVVTAPPLDWLYLFFEFAGLCSRVFSWGEWRSTGFAVLLPPAGGRRWINNLTPQPAPPELIDFLLTHPIG